ncbi:MAG: VWA domain-containing protein [Gammaproteobacteria bacterium]|nr:VWA domain-containing protein [Gammaproteobacteria bacterium]
MIALADVEQELTLFVEGIAGEFLHIKPIEEFDSSRLNIAIEGNAQTQDTLFLPTAIDIELPSVYRVLALQQVAKREFGSFRFRLDIARQRIPELTEQPIPELAGRPSDRTLFYHHFSLPKVAADLFAGFESIRVNASMLRAYPGIRRHLDGYHSHQREQGFSADGRARYVLQKYQVGLPASTPQEEAVYTLAEALTRTDRDVYDSARATYEAYSLVAWGEDADELVKFEETSVEWATREARLEDWQEELNDLDSRLLAVEMLQSEQVDALRSENAGGSVREESIDIKSLVDQRDQLARRLDMERSAIRDALGDTNPAARSYRYDEWDYLAHRYRKRWCRLFEAAIEPGGDEDLDALKSVVQKWRYPVQQQLEQIKPLGYQRVRGQTDGDEIDIDAVIRARQDVKAGRPPDDRLYSRRQRIHRDVCAALLVDLSASTDDPIESPQTSATANPSGPVPNLRDPYDDDPYRWAAAPEPEAPKRRIIDVQRESVLVMAAALEQLGDSYGIYGFSGYGRECVEYFVAKDIRQALNTQTLKAIAAMQPKRSTRMGPAIRHTVRKLTDSGNALKVLLVISDGFPQDSDYGPERGDHEYGLQDTAKALREAHQKGIETFCVTVDSSGHDYLKRMCPDSRYMVIEEVEDLPSALSKVYTALTG